MNKVLLTAILTRLHIVYSYFTVVTEVLNISEGDVMA